MAKPNVRLVNTRSAKEWAALISAKWQENVASIFEVGNLLEAAQEELGHAKFVAMYRDDLKFSKTVVSMLTAIAGDEKLRDVLHVKLPASYGTLYQLTKLTSAQFQSGIETGLIHAGMERKDVAMLRPKKKKTKKNSDEPLELQCQRKVESCIREVIMALDREGRATLFSYLRQTVDNFEQSVAEDKNDD